MPPHHLTSWFALVSAWVVLLPVLARLLKASAHVPHHEAAARAQAAKYRGVYYNKRNRAFVAALHVLDGPGYIGCFQSAKEAAEAYDQAVRCRYPKPTADHELRCKRHLNFPSEKEAAYTESPEQARTRGLKQGGCSHRKEARSFELLKAASDTSPHSEKYELERLTGSSRADALFKRRGSTQTGLPIQLKAATSQWKQGRVFRFNRLLGYDRMLVVLVALDGGHLWAAAGEKLAVDHLGITIGCGSDTNRRVENIGSYLAACFKNTQKFPHISVEEAEVQCSPNCRVEAVAHRQLMKLFSRMEWSLTCPPQHLSAVDALLEVDIEGPMLRLQEKASNFHETLGRYHICLRKNGGSLGPLPYDKDDFDLLAACILHEGQLQGVFLIPISELVQRGLVASRSCTLYLHPPWSLPKKNGTKQKYAWQQEFFLDLRTWHGSKEVPAQVKVHMERLIAKATTAAKHACMWRLLRPPPYTCETFGVRWEDVKFTAKEEESEDEGADPPEVPAERATEDEPTAEATEASAAAPSSADSTGSPRSPGSVSDGEEGIDVQVDEPSCEEPDANPTVGSSGDDFPGRKGQHVGDDDTSVDPCVNLWDGIRKQMENIIIWSLMSVVDGIQHRKGSVELFGYDFMIGEAAQGQAPDVWLIEVNSSPACDYSTPVTCPLVKQMMEDTVKIMVDLKQTPGAPTGEWQLMQHAFSKQVPQRMGFACNSQLEVLGKKMKMPKAKKKKKRKASKKSAEGTTAGEGDGDEADGEDGEGDDGCD
ncbi:TTLL3D [Symbiodinium sp. CCMP2592]|nr:TTLL3D [Symbiodinium sp. CCMP2592]